MKNHLIDSLVLIGLGAVAGVALVCVLAVFGEPFNPFDPLWP